MHCSKRNRTVFNMPMPSPELVRILGCWMTREIAHMICLAGVRDFGSMDLMLAWFRVRVLPRALTVLRRGLGISEDQNPVDPKGAPNSFSTVLYLTVALLIRV